MDLEEICRRAACRNYGEDPFFPERGQMVSPEVTALCDRCPVAVECRAWAVQHHENGYWGGTTDKMRRVMRRPRLRAACPVCASTELRSEPRHQVCTSCGTSWAKPLDKTPAQEPLIIYPLRLAA